MLEQDKADFLNYVRQKVEKIFNDFPVPGHGMDHINRVVEWAIEIAKQENCDVFYAELAAFLHDIGHVAEHQNNPAQLKHHELSYILAKEWFEQDREFDVLTQEEKDMILYAIRNHWDDTAEKYELANVLRDADKLDMYGDIGVQRAVDYYKTPQAISNNIKQNLLAVNRVKTKTAKRIIEQRNLLKPLKDYLLK